MIIRVCRLIARVFGRIRLRFKRSTPLVQPMARLRVDDCLHALEPRFMFDAAGVAVGAEAAADAVAQEQADQAIDALSNDSSLADSGDNTEPSARDLNDQLLDALATYEPPADRREFVFIDTTVHDYQTLIAGIDPSAELVLLDADRDGVHQIASVLSGRTGIDAIHIVSHGNQAELLLGTARLTLDSMSGEYSNELALIGQALTEDADLLIYGCNFGEGTLGREATIQLAQVTGADVAASIDDTGHDRYGGDWELEYQTGTIETSIAVSATVQQNWAGKLAVINVDTFVDVPINGGDGVTSLREAIIQVNAGAGGDTINLAAGTYTLSIGGTGENGAIEGDLDILKDVTISGVGMGSTIIDAGGIDRVFHVISGTSTISGLTVQGGNARAGSPGDGGGLQIGSAADVTLSNTMLTGNNARAGGAIHNDGILSLTDVTIDNNTSTQAGGGLTNLGNATLDRVTISNNTTTGPQGGGIEATAGTLTATNVTISGNSSSTSGGGIFINSTVNLQNVTMTDNTSSAGAGIKAQLSSIVNVRSTIIAGNNSSADVDGPFTSLGNNLIGNNGTATGFVDGVNGDQVGTGASPIDPMLGALADNGGFTQTHALLTGSPAIDAGTATGAPTVDQRGVTRDANVDIGAFEATVNSPPTNMVPVAQTTNQDTTLVFSSGNGNQISISDPDAGVGEMQVTLTATNGAVTLAGATGLTFSVGDGAADATMTFAGTVANINTALNGLMFDPTASYTGPASLEIITEDRGNTGAAPLDGDANITTKYTFDVDGTDAIGTNDATLNNGAAIVADAERGNVLTVDGGDDYAEVPSVVTNGLSQFTFSFWVKTTENGPLLPTTYWRLPTLFGMEIAGFGNNDLAINTENGFIGFWTGLSGSGDGEYRSLTTQINDNRWHQITLSNDGANASLYVDGVFEASRATGNGLANPAFYIGALNNSGSVGRPHSGFFDDVRIFDRSLTAQEVGDLYGLSDTDSVAITVTANSAPTLDLDADDSSGATGNDYQFTFTEGDDPTAIADSDTDVADVDSTTFDHVTLSITGLLDGDAERLAIDGDTFALATAVAGQDTSGGNYHVAITTGAGTAEVVITRQGGGTFTETETETLIKALQYQHTDTSAPTDGDRSIDVTVNDGAADSAAARTTIDVSGENDLPVATGDSATTNEDTAVTTGNVLTNDTDVDGDGLTVSAVTPPANGTVINNGDGTFTYTPNANFNGVDSFSYTVSDGNGGTDTASVTVTVNPENDLPVATDDSAITNEDTAVTTGNVLTNDTDVDGDLLTVSAVTQPANGVVLDNGDGTFIYTPNAGFNGVDAFFYTVSDGNGGTDTASVTVTVIADNDPPVANTDAVTVDEGGTVIIDLTANDTDADDGLDLTSVVIVSAPSHGSLVVNTDGTVDYTHDGSENFSDSFSYRIRDIGGALSNPTTVAIGVTPVNDNTPVITSANSASVTENSTAVHQVTASDVDLPGDGLSYRIAGTGADDAFFIIDTSGNLSFLKAPDFEAPADADGDNVYTLDVAVSDGVNTTHQTVTVTVTAVNDNAPVITSPANATVVENSTAVGQVAVSDADLPGDGISYRLTGGGADDGLFTIDAEGNLSFLMAPDFEVPADADGDNVYVVEVAVTDGMNIINQTLTVTVAEANAPVLIAPIGNEVAEDPANVEQVDASDVMLGEVVATGEGPVEPIEDQLDIEVTTAPEEPAPKATQPEPADRGPEAGRDLTRKRESEPVTIPWSISRSDLSTDILDGLRDTTLDLSTSPQPSPSIEPLEVSGFVQELDRLRTEIHEDGDLSRIIVGSSVAVTTGLSIGYVVWLVRGAVLLSSMLSSLPAWRMVDPLPVLAHLGRRSKKDGDDEESLQTVIQKGAEVAELKRSKGEPDR